MDFFNKRIKQPFLDVLKQGLTPEALSLSFTLGIVGGLFPIPGVTTLVCGLFIWLFRLNIAATQIINVILTPLELVLVVPFIQLGNMIYPSDIPIDSKVISSAMDKGVIYAVSLLWSSLLRGVLAWAIITPLPAVLIYFILVNVLRRVLNQKKKN
eukprot:TRINITY_DN2520_c1_g1_i1.p1 TRINITY_DN2520_c1_g1~~TRINITY_DN2520_c1_g1_i1.p1  ORF type:complete len:155 (-),score=2.61 TRINITY_DN2520_c1_g1_i1:27-491(-)